MNKMRWNPVKIRSCAIFRWFNRPQRFSSCFEVDEYIGFLLFDYRRNMHEPFGPFQVVRLVQVVQLVTPYLISKTCWSKLVANTFV